MNKLAFDKNLMNMYPNDFVQLKISEVFQKHCVAWNVKPQMLRML